MGVKFIGASELEEYARKPDVVFVDLREGSAYERKHLRGAISMPYEIFLARYSTLPRKNTYVLYCDRGALSVLAASVMENAGYRCVSLAGGFKNLKNL